MDKSLATAERVTIRNFAESAALIPPIAASGFRRFSTYRQATVASLTTNSMFGFLRTFVLLAVAGGGSVVGYERDQLVTYVWVGQGMLGVVMMWGWTDLADRIRSGDVVTDLLRPVHPVLNYYAADLGRAAYALLTRFTIPVILGYLVFGGYLPSQWSTYPLFLISLVLAVTVCFGCRYLVNATTYWLLDNRGVNLTWLFLSGLLGGLYFPIRFLPEPLAWAIWLATPMPSLFQAPMDVLVERDPMPLRLAMIGWQLAWAVVLLSICVAVQRRAERKLVIQGG